jgi:hypothetical protein
MTERAVELVPDLIRGQGRDGRCKYDPSATAELVRRCLPPRGIGGGDGVGAWGEREPGSTVDHAGAS